MSPVQACGSCGHEVGGATLRAQRADLETPRRCQRPAQRPADRKRLTVACPSSSGPDPSNEVTQAQAIQQSVDAVRSQVDQIDPAPARVLDDARVRHPGRTWTVVRGDRLVRLTWHDQGADRPGRGAEIFGG